MFRLGARLERAFLHDPRQPAWRRFLVEFTAFGGKQALCCLFAGFIFLMLGVTKQVQVPGLFRYDVLLIACLLFQVALLYATWETAEEALIITLFHLLGLGLELWKVHLGSWSYPGPAFTKFWGVPLFGGFMYAAVGSYVCQAWRRLDLRFERWSPWWMCLIVCLGIYANFFTNRHVPDARWILFLLVVIAFWRSSVTFVNCTGSTTPGGEPPRRRMPVLLSFILVGLFIWIAENAATFLGAWRYPNQHHGWQPVYWQKLTSWWLLVIVSIVLVAQLKRVTEPHTVGLLRVGKRTPPDRADS